MEKAMATHSSVLAWRIPGMGEPGGLPSLGSHRVGHDWGNLAAAATKFVSDSLWPHLLQHARLFCPLLSPRICSNSCPLSRWCYLTISSSATHFFFAYSLSNHQGLLQWVDSASGGQSIGASATVLLMNIQGSFPLGLTVLILQSKGHSRVFFSTRTGNTGFWFFLEREELGQNFSFWHLNLEPPVSNFFLYLCVFLNDRQIN